MQQVVPRAWRQRKPRLQQENKLDAVIGESDVEDWIRIEAAERSLSENT